MNSRENEIAYRHALDQAKSFNKDRAIGLIHSTNEIAEQYVQTILALRNGTRDRQKVLLLDGVPARMVNLCECQAKNLLRDLV